MMGATTTEAAQRETLVHLKRSHVHDLDGADDLGNFEARGERPEKGYFDGHGNWKAFRVLRTAGLFLSPPSVVRHVLGDKRRLLGGPRK